MQETKKENQDNAELKEEGNTKERVPFNKKNDVYKFLAVGLLVIVFLALVYFFISTSQDNFFPGTSVDAETFKDIFKTSNSIYILMDVRGVRNENTQRNILQCGVDFAGSSGMGGKNVSYLSAGNEGCVAPDGLHPSSFCFSEIKKGLAIYVREGTDTRYYSNGLSVGVTSQYTLGTCGIKRG